MESTKRTARIAGVLYLLFILTCAFAKIGRVLLIVPGDAAATAERIASSGWLYRFSFLSDVFSAVLFLVSAWMLYVLLKQTHKNLSLLFLVLMVGGVAVQCLNMLNQFAAVLLLSGADYLNAIPKAQLDSMALFFTDMHQNGFMIAQIFYGAWLLPLGYLVFKSRILPKFLGVLLMIDFGSVMVWFLQSFLLPGYGFLAYPGLAVSFVAEFSLSLWLMIKGVRDVQLQPVPATAG